MRQLRVLAVVLAMSLGSFAAESPFSGTWKLNPAKSLRPAAKRDVAVVDADENGLKFNEDMVDDKDQPMKLSYVAKFDGKDYPVTGTPDVDSISYRRINAHTLKGTLRKAERLPPT